MGREASYLSSQFQRSEKNRKIKRADIRCYMCTHVPYLLVTGYTSAVCIAYITSTFACRPFFLKVLILFRNVNVLSAADDDDAVVRDDDRCTPSSFDNSHSDQQIKKVDMQRAGIFAFIYISDAAERRRRRQQQQPLWLSALIN